MEGEGFQFVVPTKKIDSLKDMKRWETSDAYQKYINFIQIIGESVKGKTIREVVVTDSAQKVIDILEQMSTWVDEIKPVPLEQRFGNKAFREWHQRLFDRSTDVLKTVFGGDHNAIKEMEVYLRDSFGNPTRIDYGTGHEMAFVMLLAGLFEVGVLHRDSDEAAVGLPVFDKYMRLARKLQDTYRMEPAGSQGVWALDDYQFVSFIWGAAQFVSSSIPVTPKSIPDYEKADLLKDDYHFFACIDYISRVKTGPFAEHSNQLWNISAVASWSKVFSGLIKMYRAEVLAKFPVVQHTYFGSIFKL